jgi:hypothetical protein
MIDRLGTHTQKAFPGFRQALRPGRFNQPRLRVALTRAYVMGFFVEGTNVRRAAASRRSQDR